jgi:hypothetical protein
VLVHWDRSFTSPVTGITSRGAFGYYEVHQIATTGRLGGYAQAVYAQDQWRISPRVTLNVGVRSEYESVPSFAALSESGGRFRIPFQWSTKVAPRLGASVDLLGDGKARIFASWGRFFDPTRYALPRGAFGGDAWRIRYRSLDTLDVFSLGGNNAPGRDLWDASVPGSFRLRPLPRFDDTTADPALKPAGQDSISAGFEYEWTRNRLIAVRYLHQNLRRAIEDLSILLNGDDYYVSAANPGEGAAVEVRNTTGLTQPFPFPRPVRKYDALEFRFFRRLSGGWFGDASYTWSRLYGNYSGVASSDELRTPTTGGSIARPGSYAKNDWDIDEIMFDANGNLAPQGPLATDRTHAFKFTGAYRFPWGAHAGAFVYAASGTPLTTKVLTTNFLPVFVEGRNDMGRTPRLAYADLNIGHEVRIDESRSVRVELNILNAFDTRTSRHRFEHLNRGAGAGRPTSSINLSRVDLRRGYDYRALIAASPDGINAFDPRYGMDDLFNPGRSARLGLRFIF